MTAPPELDPVIHAQARLRVVSTLSTLAEGDRITFPRLQEILQMTAGNLSVHLRKLEDADYVEITKTHQGRTPTTLRPADPARPVGVRGVHRRRCAPCSTHPPPPRSRHDSRPRRSRSAAATATSPRSTRSASRSGPANSSACSARTAPARAPCSACSSAYAGPPPAGSSCSAATRATRRSRQRLGVTPQETGLPPTLRVGEVVDFVSAHYSNPVPRAELLDRFGLTDLARRQTGGLSGGQKRRLAVALAFVGRPQLVILDEPTTGLDVEARHSLWDAIRAFHDDGGTVLLSSHYLEEIEALAQRVVVLGEGRVLADDTVAAVRDMVGVRRVSLVAARAAGAARRGRRRARATGVPTC